MLDWWHEQNRINGQIRELRDRINELSKSLSQRISKLEVKENSLSAAPTSLLGSIYESAPSEAQLDKEEAEERDQFIKKIGLINNIPYDELYALAEKHGY